MCQADKGKVAGNSATAPWGRSNHSRAS
jgi:hypothetical protein